MKTINNLISQYINFAFALCLLFCSCSNDESQEISIPEDNIFYLPVIVHVIHKGENIGEDTNLSTERIERQIEILNEDFRRKVGTRGYNEHPDGGDAKIEFVLAKKDRNGNPTNGINRINENTLNGPYLGYNQNNYAQYGYWDSSNYINIWTTPLSGEYTECLVFGSATGPDINLPGSQFLPIPQLGDPEGILINWMHFGESNIDCQARFGRTLTHEMGHYLGVLHPWGGNDCEFNDYCDDTPAVDRPVYNSAFMGCEGETVATNNYMNWSDDEMMNMFTKDQISRMHNVLEHHEGRHNLLSSPAIK